MLPSQRSFTSPYAPLKGKLLVTDLDETLLDDEQKLSDTDRQTLVELGACGVIRLVATGRHWFSASKVISADFPIDYVAVSSGASVMTFPALEPLYVTHMPTTDALAVAAFLQERQADFMLHAAVPENHRFYYWRSSPAGVAANPDFDNRIQRYREYAQAWPCELPEGFSQFVVVEPPAGPSLYAALCEAFSASCSVVVTTSPLDRRSRWVEVFPKSVSKGSAAGVVAQRHGVAEGWDTAAVGNDTNEWALLRWAARAYVVASAHADVRREFQAVARGNGDSGFTAAVEQWLKECTGEEGEKRVDA